MSTDSSNGEVFGQKVLYGAMVALSAMLLFASFGFTAPQPPHRQTATSAPVVAESVVVTASRANLS